MKNTFQTFKIFLFALVSFLFSCDIVENSKDVYYIQATEEENIDTTTGTYEKNVLLLEFTGHRCINCPEAHESIDMLKGIYGENLIPVAIHTTSLALPYGEFTTNFTTADGELVKKAFGISAIPTGVVNFIDKTKLSSHTSWADEIETELSKPNILGLNITNNYNTSDRNLSIKVKYEILENFNANLKLGVYLLEDSIISKQLFPGDSIAKEYEHRHVFRDAITDVWGETIQKTTFTKGFKEELSFSTQLNSAWNENKCIIVAFIYDDTTKEILNTEEKNISE